MKMYAVGNSMPCELITRVDAIYQHDNGKISCSIANLLSTILRIVLGETSFAPTVQEWGNVNIEWELDLTLSAFQMTKYDMYKFKSVLVQLCDLCWDHIKVYAWLAQLSPL